MIKAASGGRGEGDDGGGYRIKVLEGGIKKAKESERKMLESLVSQTKQLEQAKMELEEARLEIRNLQKSARAPSARNLFRSLLEKPPPPPSAPGRPGVSEEEVARLKGELRLATEAEEKSKRAMDGLALALKEVTEEANQSKDKLAAASAEADRLKSALEAREVDLRAVSAEVERLRLEAEESAAAWSAKEEVLISCVKAADEENRRLLDSREEAREENARLRDIMKQALSEANAAMAGLEVARRENYELKSQLKAAGEEAAAAAAAAASAAAAVALQSARQPKCLPTSWRSRSARSSGSGSSGKPAEDMFQSERWGGDGGSGLRIQNGAKAPKAGAGSYGTVGCVSNMKLNSLLGLGGCRAASFRHGQKKVGSDGRSRGSGGSADKQKRKQILRKFDKLLRKKSLRSYEKVPTAATLAL